MAIDPLTDRKIEGLVTDLNKKTKKEVVEYTMRVTHDSPYPDRDEAYNTIFYLNKTEYERLEDAIGVKDILAVSFKTCKQNRSLVHESLKIHT